MEQSCKKTQTAEWMKEFYARHPELLYRTTRPKDIIKTDAEDPEKKPFCTALQNVQLASPGTLDDVRRFFNRNEVKFISSTGEKENILRSFGRDRGGRHEKVGTDKHVTTVVSTNEAGENLPMKFIVEGKLELNHWYEPIPI